MIRLADLLQIFKRDSDAIARIDVLGRELVQLDERRAVIIAELAELGIGDNPINPESNGTGGEASPAAPPLYAQAVPGLLVRQDRLLVPTAAEDRIRLALAEGNFKEAARLSVMAAQILDFEKGIIDEVKLAEETNRRQGMIDQMAAEMRAGASNATCSECGEPATAVIAGVDYCDAHAATAPRPGRPSHLMAVA